MTAAKKKPLSEKDAELLRERNGSYQFLASMEPQLNEVRTRIRIVEAILDDHGIPFDTDPGPAPEPVIEPPADESRQQRRARLAREAKAEKRAAREAAEAQARAAAAAKKAPVKKRAVKKRGPAKKAGGATKATAKLKSVPTGDGAT